MARDNTSVLDSSTESTLTTILEELSLPYITSTEQSRLAVIVYCMDEVLSFTVYVMIV